MAVPVRESYIEYSCLLVFLKRALAECRLCPLSYVLCDLGVALKK